MIRVLIADDQRLLREGLRMILQTAADLEVVGEAADGDAAVTLAAAHAPDVVLMDLRMPGTDGVAATRRLLAASRPPRVLVLTTFDDDESIFSALKAGAAGYLLKDVPAAELIAAVRTVAAGGALMPPAIAARVLDEFARLADAAPAPPPAAPVAPDQPAPADDLTRRELDILALLVQGRSNREIAAALYLAEGTVKNHVSHIFAKLGARDRAHAVVLALARGLGSGGAAPGS